MTTLHQFEYTQNQKKKMLLAKLFTYLSQIVIVIGLSGVQFGLQSYIVAKNMITNRIGLHLVLLPINHKIYNLQEKNNS